MLDARTGTVLRTVAVAGEPSIPAVDDRANRLFVSAFTPGKHPGHGTLTVLDSRSGRVVARTKVGGIPSAIVVAQSAGRVFVQTYDPTCGGCASMLNMIDATTGTMLGARPVGTGGRFVVDEQHERLYMTIGSTLTVLDARSGKSVWKRDLDPCGWGMVFIRRTQRLFTTTGGTVGRGSAGRHGYFCVVDTDTRKVVRAVDEGEGVLVRLLAVDEPAGVVLATIRGPRGSGAVELLDARDGHVVRQFSAFYGAVAAAVDSRTGRIYVLSRDSAAGSTLRVLDPRGWRSTEIVQGLKTSSIAVAEQAHRVFLANPYSGRVTVLCSERSCR
jgi:DNA-binding beta-propeller fold protein YncE